MSVAARSSRRLPSSSANILPRSAIDFTGCELNASLCAEAARGGILAARSSLYLRTSAAIFTPGSSFSESASPNGTET